MREADSSPFRSSGSWYGPIAALLIAGACLAEQHPALAADKAAVERLRANLEQADYAGAGVCKSCHVDTAEHYSYTLHSAVFELNPRTELEQRNCEACHGPGSIHIRNPTAPDSIIGFDMDAVADTELRNEQCLNCHSGGERIQWHGSMHDLQDLSCSDCHNPMAKFSQSGLLREQSVVRVCFDCHQQQRLEFSKRSHMPVLEGQVSCVDCHNPHGGNADPLLKETTVNSVCYNCHAEKRGPFLWEHAPVRENCMNCHQPHGSNHEFLLNTARPFLCQQCHSHLRHPNDLQTTAGLPGGAAPDERLLNRSCQNCHSQIHGSNHPSGVRMHR